MCGIYMHIGRLEFCTLCCIYVRRVELMFYVGLFGKSGVGKTTWLASHLQYIPTETLGIETRSVRFDGVNFIFHDTSGKIQYDTLLESTIPEVNGVILMYDTSDWSSFALSLLWLKQFMGREDTYCALLGVPNEPRIISSVDVALAVKPWIRQQKKIWYDELEKTSFRSILRFFIKSKKNN